jgi:hypothetical protein
MAGKKKAPAKRKLNMKMKPRKRQSLKEEIVPSARKIKRLRNVEYNSMKNKIIGANKTLNDPDLTEKQKERLITRSLGIKTTLDPKKYGEPSGIQKRAAKAKKKK